ncbi:Rv1733c family protein [Rhodococcus sp. T7]|uniref:Rv1733c family protein n=1 Tax=Rhodococcus sp. T7 TaxID=627444 RepID=UPI00135BADDA|nr:hypothetical protein [Rhodococcus sp. T7]KAF0958727.1 hypothetical protein MLGJGCBP_08160 [Rhodococcus sp. T7]
MNESDASFTRWWRLGPWNCNSLTRSGDRVESTVVLVMVMFVLLLVPFACAFGTATYTRLTDEARIARQTEQQVSAVLLANPLPPMGDVPVRGPVGPDRAPAHWSVNGTEHTGDVATGIGDKAGQTVTIWVDSHGNYMTTPNTGTENGFEAVVAALAFWSLGTVINGVLLVGVHSLITKHHLAQWQREWSSLGQAPGSPVR